MMALLLSASALPACKSRTAEPAGTPGATVAAASAATAPGSKVVEAKRDLGSAVAPGAAPAPAAPHGTAASGVVDPLSVPAVPVPPGDEIGKAPGETVTVKFVDPETSPHKSVTTCPGDKLAIVVPALAGDWSVVKSDATLGTPVQDVVKGWPGPGTDGAKFTWTIEAATNATVVLEQKQTHVKVALDVAAFGCD